MNSPEMTRIGINGFGRIGTLLGRETINTPEMSLVVVNNGRYSAEDAAKRLRYDGIHGRFHEDNIKYDDKNILFYGQPISVANFRRT